MQQGILRSRHAADVADDGAAVQGSDRAEAHRQRLAIEDAPELGATGVTMPGRHGPWRIAWMDGRTMGHGNRE